MRDLYGFPVLFYKYLWPVHFNVTLFMQATTTPSIFIAKMVQYKMNLCRKNLNDVVNEGCRLQIMEANEG